MSGVHPDKAYTLQNDVQIFRGFDEAFVLDDVWMLVR